MLLLLLLLLHAAVVSGDWTDQDLDYVRTAWGHDGDDVAAYERFKQVAQKWDPEGRFRDGEGFLE